MTKWLPYCYVTQPQVGTQVWSDRCVCKLSGCSLNSDLTSLHLHDICQITILDFKAHFHADQSKKKDVSKVHVMS